MARRSAHTANGAAPEERPELALANSPTSNAPLANGTTVVVVLANPVEERVRLMKELQYEVLTLLRGTRVSNPPRTTDANGARPVVAWGARPASGLDPPRGSPTNKLSDEASSMHVVQGAIAGANWNHYFVGPLQILICFAMVVAGTLLAGQSMKAIYMMENPGEITELYGFIIISGAFMLILSQMPSYHSLRHLNFISLLLSLAYSACATAGSIHVGSSSSIAQGRDYSILGDTKNRIFGAFSAISIIAAAYGNCLIPEIQACLQPTNQLLEKIFADVKKKPYSPRNVIPRVISRSLVAIFATFIAAMLPFFRDIIGLIGAFGVLPLVFVMPIVMHTITFKPSRRGCAFWISMSIVVIFLTATLMGCIAAVREIVRDANTYRLFANV
ncbi:GABA transporter 1 [Platanthera guangdongensis]|uniref:GABA transporter 1 n=1 Tax=Platanthera guangdongensis TaxID=2320717 RepID=A0ABR2M524_9ASPA